MLHNRLTEFNGNSISYDPDGNMLSDGLEDFTYDSSNRLIVAKGHSYTYNAENVRIRNLCEEEDTIYTYDTNCKLSKLLCKTTNGVTTKYVYGRGLIGEETNNVFKTYHFDNRGSTVAITNFDGGITDTFTYDTYGKCINRTGTSSVIFGYNGRDGVVTDSNGLIYMRARYYAPYMKRFINADIIAGDISNAVTLNRFAYANGNPVSFIDPFGLMSQEALSLYNKLTRDEKKYYDLEKQIVSEKARKSKLALDEEKLSSTIHGKPKTFSTQYRKALLDETRNHGNPLARSPRYDKLTLDEKKFQEHAAKHFNTDISFSSEDGYAYIAVQDSYGNVIDVIKTNLVDSINETICDDYLKMLDEIFGCANSEYFSEYLGTTIKLVSVGKEIYDGYVSNVKAGESWGEIGTDAALDAGSTLIPIGIQAGTTFAVTKIGAAIGTSVAPGLGTAIGTIAGFLAGIAYDAWGKPALDNLL